MLNDERERIRLKAVVCAVIQRRVGKYVADSDEGFTKVGDYT